MKNTGDKPKKRIFKREMPGKLKLPLVILFGLFTGLGLSLANMLINTQSIKYMFLSLGESTLAVLASALFLALLVLFITLVSRSLFAGGLSVSLLLLVTSFINYFKNLITATPLQLSDVALITKIGQIAGLNSSSITFSRNSIFAIIAVFLWLAVLFVFSRPLRLRWRLSLPCAGAAAVIFVVLFCVRPVADGWLFKPLYTPLNANYGQAYVTGKTGVVLGLWRSVIAEDAAAAPDEEEALSLMDEAKAMADAEKGGRAPGEGEDPNVIVILSESFFDITELPGVTYDEDPLADFHRAQAEGVSGVFHTRTLGYGTCSIEMEILTGINTRYLSSDQLLSEWDPSEFDKLSTVPGIFRDRGYYTAFLHSFDDSIYNRTATYTHLGFDDLFFSGDFAKIDPEAAAAPDYWAFMQQKIKGQAYSDEYLADLMIQLSEQNEGPVFLYGATMENHTPFEADKYDSYDYSFTSDLNEEATGVLNAVTQGAANSSAALGKLMEYYSNSDEPTIIVFFGDHRPGLPLENSGGTLYSALGMCGEDNSQWSVETLAELYSTTYVIWANDESLLPAPAGTTGADTSSNFLGLDILRAADVELDGYWRMIASVKEDVTAYTWYYFIASDGTLAAAPEDCLDEPALHKLDIMTYLVREAYSDQTVTPAFHQLD